MLVMRKSGKFLPMPTGVTRHNVRFEARKLGPSQEKRNFLIAPTICMKTKAKFRQGSIAPTMLMKINKLIVFQGRCHDVDERKYSYPMN
jgi:hypothetical protein